MTDQPILTHRAARWDKMLSKPEAKLTRLIRLAGGASVMSTPLAICVAAVSAFLGSLIILVATAPPMVRRRSRRSYEVARISLVAVFAWALAAAAVAAAVAGCL